MLIKHGYYKPDILAIGMVVVAIVRVPKEFVSMKRKRVDFEIYDSRSGRK